MPGNASEILTRSTEYIMARKAGKSQIVAIEEAGRVSAPFHHVGRLKFGFENTVAPYVRSVAYFNSSLQVFKQTKDSLGTKSGRTRYAFAALSMIAASASTALYLMAKDDDDEQKQLFKSIPPDAMTKYVYLPNPYSSKRLLQIRIPEQLGFLSGLFNMMIIEQADQTDYKWTEYGQAATNFMPQQVNPFGGVQALFSWAPQAIKPGAETIFGVKTYPSLRPIETSRDQSLPPELRYNAFTSPAAKFLGEQLGWSPKKIDHFLEGTFGRSVKYITGKPGGRGVTDIFGRELYFEASRQVQFYYEIKQINQQDVKAYLDGRKEFTKEQVDRMFAIEDLVIDITAILEDYKNEKMEDLDSPAVINARNDAFKKIRDLEKLIYF